MLRGFDPQVPQAQSSNQPNTRSETVAERPAKRRGRSRVPTPQEAQEAERSIKESIGLHHVHDGNNARAAAQSRKCPFEQCPSQFKSAWALAAHLNANHPNFQMDLPPDLRVAKCSLCFWAHPIDKGCPNCNLTEGPVVREIRRKMQAPSLPPHAQPPPILPSASSGIEISDYLGSPQQTLSHVPLAARPVLGEILTTELHGFAISPSVERLQRILVLPRILLRKGRGGLRRARAEEIRLQEKMELWQAGEVHMLWKDTCATSKGEEGLKRRLRNKAADARPSLAKLLPSILSLTRQGLPGKALRLVVSHGVAEWNEATTQSVQHLFPRGDTETIPALHRKQTASLWRK